MPPVTPRSPGSQGLARLDPGYPGLAVCNLQVATDFYRFLK